MLKRKSACDHNCQVCEDGIYVQMESNVIDPIKENFFPEIQDILEEGELNNISNNDDSFYAQTENKVIDPVMEKFFSEVGQSKEFWKHIDKCSEKLIREPSWNLPLVGERTYFLNKSHSKWVCVGLLPDNFFEPMVKIVGVKKQCVTFNEEEWKEFMKQSVNLKKYFDYCSGNFPTVDISNFKLSCECFDGVNKILKIENDGDMLYLSYEGLTELWRMRKVVESRFVLLRNLKYYDFYKNILDYLVVSGEDLNLEVEKILEGSMSECVCITKEMFLYHLVKIYTDVDLLRKNRV